MLIFQNNTIESLFYHAEAAYPYECCGILIGSRSDSDRIVHSTFFTPNSTDESKAHTHFAIDPLDIIRAEARAESEGLEIVGFYHSHPDREAIASSKDALHMIAEYSYPIISVKGGRSVALNSFIKKAQTDLTVSEEGVKKE